MNPGEAACGHRMAAARKSGMPREASRGSSAATLPPRRQREESRAQSRNCQPATHSNIIALSASECKQKPAERDDIFVNPVESGKNFIGIGKPLELQETMLIFALLLT